MKAIDILNNMKLKYNSHYIEETNQVIRLDEAIEELESIAINTNGNIKKPKFKIGDWVIYTGGGYCDGEILQITNIDEKDFCSFGNYNKLYHFNKLRLWKPKKGKLHWFWNEGTTLTVLELLEILEDGNRKYFAGIAMPNGTHSLGGYYQYCEPFIGTLPTMLQK